jgi:(R,R)-butanediol dehydrogenase / meso-butanediol dehydrogenase / diacetyl reductase
MIALRWYARGDVRLEEVEPPPPPRAGEVQLRIAWCGICGTDLEEWKDGPFLIPDGSPHPLTGERAPITLGHELSGTVVATGGDVGTLSVGDLVAVDGLMYCGKCRECRRHRVNLCEQKAQVGFSRDGGLQELTNVPAAACLLMPASAAPEAGAVAETLSVGVRSLRQGRLQRGERVAIYGGGAVGLLALQAARAAGAGHITLVEPLANRRQMALDLGADEAVAPPEGPAAVDLAADVVLECSGRSAAIEAAVLSARSSGRVVLVGITSARVPLSIWDIVVEEKSVIGSLSHVWDEDFARALDLLASGAVVYEPLLTRIPLVDALDLGLRALDERPSEHIKILVHP